MLLTSAKKKQLCKASPKPLKKTFVIALGLCLVLFSEHGRLVIRRTPSYIRMIAKCSGMPDLKQLRIETDYVEQLILLERLCTPKKG
jgi:hypothetical protein